VIKKIKLKATLNEDLDSLKLINNKVFLNTLEKLKGKEINVFIEVGKAGLSVNQYRYWYGVMYETILNWSINSGADYITRAELHTYVMTEILNHRFDFVTIDEKVYVDISNDDPKEWSNSEYSAKKSIVQKHYAELGCVIDDPIKPNELNNYNSYYK